MRPQLAADRAALFSEELAWIGISHTLMVGWHFRIKCSKIHNIFMLMIGMPVDTADAPASRTDRSASALLGCAHRQDEGCHFLREILHRFQAAIPQGENRADSADDRDGIASPAVIDFFVLIPH